MNSVNALDRAQDDAWTFIQVYGLHTAKAFSEITMWMYSNQGR